MNTNLAEELYNQSEFTLNHMEISKQALNCTVSQFFSATKWQNGKMAFSVA